MLLFVDNKYNEIENCREYFKNSVVSFEAKYSQRALNTIYVIEIGDQQLNKKTSQALFSPESICSQEMVSIRKLKRNVLNNKGNRKQNTISQK